MYSNIFLIRWEKNGTVDMIVRNQQESTDIVKMGFWCNEETILMMLCNYYPLILVQKRWLLNHDIP